MVSLFFEEKYGFPKKIIAGVDEVGRGALAGPVVSAAVIPSNKKPKWLNEVNDSKKVPPKLRLKLEPLIKDWSLAWSIKEASEFEIDKLNILKASHIAMIRAINSLNIKPNKILIDGKIIPKIKNGIGIISGDSLSISIACASILAKVKRDMFMSNMCKKYPIYGFTSNKGYPTKYHLMRLKKYGPSPIHRMSFKPVYQSN